MQRLNLAPETAPVRAKQAGTPADDPLRVLIAGGGAGGLVLAIALARQNRWGRRRYAVTLVDPNATHVWKPLLHEFASGSADASYHEAPYIALARWHGFSFAQGPLEDIDRGAQEALIGAAVDETGAELAPPRRLAYDRLVIAVGGVTNDFGTPGVRDHAYMLDSAADAERLHKRIIQICTRANYGLTEGIGEHLDIAIVGGGATGVELAAELRTTTRELIAYGLDRLDPERFIRLRLVNADPRLLMQLPARVADAVDRILRELNVEIMNGEQVVEAAADHLSTKSGRRVPADLTVWAAGVKAPDFLRGIAGLETNRAGQLMVTPALQTTRDAKIFAIGDCASAEWHGRGKAVPPRAQAAAQEARYLAGAFRNMLAGRDPGPFRYNDLGSLVSLGETSAVGTLMGWVRGAGLRIEGAIAQFIYRWLYKCHQAALYGWWAVLIDMLGRWARGATRPAVKVH
jgi:NADH dehydrogenase